MPIDCARAVPQPVDELPLRSPQVAHTAVARHLAGRAIAEIGTRNGDSMACFSQVARSSLAIESDPRYCAVLRRRCKGSCRPVCADYKTVDLRAVEVFTFYLYSTFSAAALRELSSMHAEGKIRHSAEAVVMFDLHRCARQTPHCDDQAALWRSLRPQAKWSEAVDFDEADRCGRRGNGKGPGTGAGCARAAGTMIVAGFSFPLHAAPPDPHPLVPRVVEQPEPAAGRRALGASPIAALILTTCMRPFAGRPCHERAVGCNHAFRKNTLPRRETYATSIRLWATRTALPLVVAESCSASAEETAFLRALVPPLRRSTVEFLPTDARGAPSIGAAEGLSVLSALRDSVLLNALLRFGAVERPRERPMARLVFVVTGRYFLPTLPAAVRAHCAAPGSPVRRIAFQNPSWAGRRLGCAPGANRSMCARHGAKRVWQETSAIGFELGSGMADSIYGWARGVANWTRPHSQAAGNAGGPLRCAECHTGLLAARLRKERPAQVCELPPLRVEPPVREGSSGVLRRSI